MTTEFTSLKTRKRSHTCGELRAAQAGQKVTLAGWVDRRREHGQLVFVDLRDRYGKTQVTIDLSTLDAEQKAVVEHLRSEFVIQVQGEVSARAPEQKNPKLATGEIEVLARSIAILNRSVPPPFDVSAPGTEGDAVDLERRLEHRIFDLRRAIMQQRLVTRHKVVHAIRTYFDREGFVDVETPILTRSTPEGSRDYLVPSRVHKGQFYALPQSPQLFKQLLMVAGYDRYYQIARCFRDEDLRADRQPEFTQIDIEMSFVEMEDIFSTVEGLFAHVFERTGGPGLQPPIERLPYDEAMRRFGTDRPDLRFGLELVDL
ncbi:MAG TPA: aspartate--tRNA ligase, partial [Planctomycetota bacterium]|nr:aspartate--tRNA ligase [Planctomycetota bacterium]